MSWDQRFFDPIELPNGRKLVTLRDAAQYTMKLPKAEQRAMPRQTAAEMLMLVGDQGLAVTIAPQTELNIAGKKYRIDFVIASPDLKLAIEIDGHDFHEKTKEQAASDRSRERSIVREGYTLMRFTGSEIFRNPRSCVNEVVEQIKVLRQGNAIS